MSVLPSSSAAAENASETVSKSLLRSISRNPAVRVPDSIWAMRNRAEKVSKILSVSSSAASIVVVHLEFAFDVVRAASSLCRKRPSGVRSAWAMSFETWLRLSIKS